MSENQKDQPIAVPEDLEGEPLTDEQLREMAENMVPVGIRIEHAQGMMDMECPGPETVIGAVRDFLPMIGGGNATVTIARIDRIENWAGQAHQKEASDGE